MRAQCLISGFGSEDNGAQYDFVPVRYRCGLSITTLNNVVRPTRTLVATGPCSQYFPCLHCAGSRRFGTGHCEIFPNSTLLVRHRGILGVVGYCWMGFSVFAKCSVSFSIARLLNSTRKEKVSGTNGTFSSPRNGNGLRTLMASYFASRYPQ